LRRINAAAVVFVMIMASFSLLTTTAPTVGSKEMKYSGFSGVSWDGVVPINKALFVNYDTESFVDDYAYLAAVPASTFYSDSQEEIFSNPVLFYEPEIPGDDHRTMNANPGIHYLMEDVLTYAGGQLDSLQMINIPSESRGEVEGMAPSTDVTSIDSSDPFVIAEKIALSNWEYSDKAVVAVIDTEFPVLNELSEYTRQGSTPAEPVVRGTFEGEKDPEPSSPNFHDFVINDGYRYIDVDMEWGNEYNPIKDITERGKDPDLQLYMFLDDGSMMQVGASAEWNVLSGAMEHISSVIYEPGDWSAAVTYIPTQGFADDDATSVTGGARVNEDEPVIDLPPDLPGPLGSTARYTIDYTCYPGVDIVIDENTPFMCEGAVFTLTWGGSSASLGMAVLGPSGAMLGSAMGSGSDALTLELEKLGSDSQYTVTVFRLSEEVASVDFDLNIDWYQGTDESMGDAFSSAAEGAVIASTENAPLLFVTPTKFPSSTSNALDKLGVKDVILVDLNDRSGKKLSEKIEDSRSWLQPDLNVKKITSFKDAYQMIKTKSQTNDIVFTTIDPWTPWTVGEGKLEQEADGALYIGPAAYTAAHHGAPLIITDVHSKTSASQAWHYAFWDYAYPSRLPPSVGDMALTGWQVYDLLEEMGLDEEGPETIITVAGQFDIGAAWDRMLVGAANSGRIVGTPVDAAMWVNRNSFYPAIIFSNPAIEGGSYITGSESTGPNGAVITKEGGEVQLENAILESWVSYNHRFNERASEYWGCDYEGASGVTPFRTPSDDPIDDGVNSAYGQTGSYWPDITSSEVFTFYAKKGGYESAYTTNFDTTMENLNRGVLLWMEVMHGGNRGAGIVGFWDDSKNEPNPWRGYESGGATDNPDTVTMSKNTGADIRPGYGPLTDVGLIPEHHDGIVIALAQQVQTVSYDGYDFDDALENLHSAGFNGGSCLISNTLLHMSLIRHGSVYQVIDPWLTSWYSGFACEIFVRALIQNATVGEAYTEGIGHVGILYLTGQWWWDIYENLVYFGDPDLKLYLPTLAWDKPVPLPAGEVIDGHAVFGARSHPHAIGSTTLYEAMIVAMIIFGAVTFFIFHRRRKAGFSLGKLVRRADKSETPKSEDTVVTAEVKKTET